ncbi:MAG: hemerythrin domain-containing protein [Rhodanobacter sp.]|nr:MAG: hemerythrin domain-containing protein [Rhodanobacter sp.]TAL99971.1 MAG: hemerythrin domain-containing protein [Rhodanobacter sp.]TAM43087.1 MAG: hemerythrin domain-containing protein [Rhodanobacter sp.]
MDMELPSRLLAVQHHQIDQGVEGIVDGTGEPQALAAALKLLREHVYVEEYVLFPPLAGAGLTMPVFVMKREHGEMWPLIRGLEAACAAGVAAADLREDALMLLQRLKVHNPKEEQIVYAAADRHESAHPDAPLLQAMAAARMPEDWVCALAPH